MLATKLEGQSRAARRRRCGSALRDLGSATQSAGCSLPVCAATAASLHIARDCHRARASSYRHPHCCQRGHTKGAYAVHRDHPRSQPHLYRNTDFVSRCVLVWQDIRLDANLYIPDGGELLLNIQVPPEEIRVDSYGPAKVTRVYSDHADGVWGVGELIYVFVEFTSAVEAVGAPSLILRTGCHTSTCHTREVQRLRCQATGGKFSVSFAGQVVRNIPYDANQRMFADYLTRMTQLDKVSVAYSISDTACTFFGNNITVTFESTNIGGGDGDLPEMMADKDNNGGDGTSLFHIRFKPPTLTPQAWEIQKGNKVPDRVATFAGQSDPKTLKFAYTVLPGDSAPRLDYASSDSLELSLRGAAGNSARIYNANSGQTVRVNAKLPPPGFSGDWERGIGSSLSATKALKIDVSRPVVTDVTSPHGDGTFGIGEVILIHVQFSHPIVVTGGPTIVLETGIIDRIVPFVQVVDGNIAQFRYIVQSKDTSPDLAYAGTNVLELNGGSVKRMSTAPFTDAILKLPVNGEQGSLSVNKNIVIDTTNPEVVSVAASSPDGVYTAGDTVEIVVGFKAPVVVTGTPVLLLSTGSVDLFPGSSVLAAPISDGVTMRAILFPPVNHGLSTAESKGLQFSIGGQILTVDSVNGDHIKMVESYTGTVVDPVIVAAGGGPSIAIKTPGYRRAVYYTGSGTQTLSFRYTVQRGDVSLDLDYTSTSALQLNGGSIKRQSMNPVTDADLTLAAPGAIKSLGRNSAIVINTNAPRILQANPLTRDGVYRAGDIISFALVFDLPVVVLNTATVLMSVTEPERYATFSKGSGSTVLEFTFVCGPSDQAAVFDFVDSKSLRASLGSIFGDIRRKAASPMLPAELRLPVARLTSKGISINQACERAVSVSSTHEDDTIGAGETVELLVNFSANVAVDTTNGTPTLVLATTREAVYARGTGSKELVFRYTVRADDAAVRLNYDGIYALRLNDGSIVASADQRLVSTVLPAPELSPLALQSAIFIDTSPPRVLSVMTKTLDGVYSVGDVLVITVRFSSPVVATSNSAASGIPTLLLNVGDDEGFMTQFVVSEDDALYFSYAVLSGHSIARLSYYSRVALKCAGGSGMNQLPAQDATIPSAAAVGTRIFIAWSEVLTATTKAQIRVKSFDARQFPPDWVAEDGGSTAASSVQFDALQSATAPSLLSFIGKLHIAWQEVSTAANSPTQVRVAVYRSVAPSGVGVQQWSFVDRASATTAGLNRDPSQNAAAPSLIAHDAKLYAAWHETSAASGISQIRVAVYNGQDQAPIWTFVDGNQLAKGINYAAAGVAQNVRLGSCASLANSFVMVLYAAWEERDVTTNAQQIRVAALTGFDASPRWVFADGNTAAGINYNAAASATSPSLACMGSSLVVAWSESATTATGAAVTRVRAKQFNGNLASPSWKPLDNAIGLNFDASQRAANVRLHVQTVGLAATLFATWDESDANTGSSQVRVASFVGTVDAPRWTFLDGAHSASSINNNAAQSAAQPTLVVSPVAEYSLFVFWHEIHAMNGKSQVRGAGFLGSSIATCQWQSLHDTCVRRKSSAPLTVANLLLPELNTPDALDFDRIIRIDSSPPVVQGVMLSGDIARVLSTALTVQTVDVYNRASLTQGSFKLVYGDGHETACVNWNALATGTNSMEAVLESIPDLVLDVSVTKDTSAFHDGHRFTITFHFPTMGLQPLRVKDSELGDGCASFDCSSSAIFSCTLHNLVRVNQNADVTYRPGVLDALVRFTSPVVVATGTPKLALETGPVDTEASYTPRSALQEFDVGTEAPSPIVRGSFRLVYGDFAGGGAAIRTTDCIDVPLKDEDGVQEFSAKLKAAIPELTTIGISSITRRRLRNGYRYSIWLRNSPDLLDLAPADASSCPQFAGRTQTIDISASSRILQGEFTVQFGDAKSGCIPWNIRARGGGGSLALTSLQSILGGAVVPGRTIPVQVTKDPSVFAIGHRYVVNFMRLDDAREDLLVFQDPACVAFRCDGGGGALVPCGAGLKLAVNADYKATRAVSETLSFRYLVQSTDNAQVLTYGNPLTALSGNILRASKTPTVAATLALPSPAPPLQNELGAQVTIVSEAEIPRVLRVYSTSPNGEYTVGDEIVLALQFSGVVQVQGAPILELNSKGVAEYFAGSGTDTLEFRYKVAAGEGAATLNYATVYALVIPNSITYIRYGATEDAPSALLDVDMLLPSLTSASSLAIVVDTSTPTIVSVSSLHPSTAVGGLAYGTGDVLLLTVEFSKEVSVLGTPPTMKLDSSVTAVATFTFGGHRQLIDVGVYATYPLTSGHFAVKYGAKQSGCIDFNDANSNAASSFRSRLLEIEAVRAIGITSVTLLAIKNGHRFEVLFTMTAASAIPLAIEPVVSDVCAPLLPSADSPEKVLVRATDKIVVFQYDIHEGDASADLDFTGAALSLPAADSKVVRQSKDPTLAADLSLPPTGSANRLKAMKDLVVDGAPIVILDIVSDSAGGTYGVAFPPTSSPASVSPGEILFRVVFSRPVRVEGSPTIELTTGSLQPNGVFLANRFATYVNQPQPNQAAFLYHIQEGDFSSNLAFPDTHVLANARIFGVSTSSSQLTNLELPRLTVSGTSTIRIDANSVPTTVKISSSHSDGTFGAGEAIEIQITFSKSVVMQTGLNQNHTFFARYPTSILFQGNIYVLWTEWERLHVRTKSYLYLAVFSSATLERIPTAASPVAINRLPDTFIERAAMTLWDNTIYAAWSENGLIYCARYNGIAAVTAWTLVPNKGLNRNLVMEASDAFLLVHNLLLVLLWREVAVIENGSGALAGQIRITLLNDDRDAPLWIFHDGNELNAGLNKNPKCDAKAPMATVFKGTMFATWAEARPDDSQVYDVVIVRRNIISRDVSTWRYLDPLASTKPMYSFISTYRPRLAVRRHGFEDSVLMVTWQRHTVAENVTEVVTGVVSDSSWESSPTVAESVPYTLDGSRNALVSQQIDTNQLEIARCGDALYAVWMQAPLPTRTSTVNVAVLGAAGSVYSGWKTVYTGNLNHNQVFDSLDANLVCSSTATAASSAEVGLFWTEFDGYSTKLRFRHQKVPPRSTQLPRGGWEEVSSGTPLLKLTTGAASIGNAINVDRSGIDAYVLNFVYIVKQGDSAQDIDVLDRNALVLNGASLEDSLGQLPDYTLFPRSNDPRSLSYNKDIKIDTTPPSVVSVTAETPSGEYGVGQRLLIQVVFTTSVSVVAPAATSVPVLYLRSDELHFLSASVNPATYISGSGTRVLTFEYIASELDFCEKLEYFNENSLALLGGSKILRSATFLTTDALLTLPPPKSPYSLSGNRAIAIKPTQPRVLQVTAVEAGGTYRPGDKLTLQVTFSLPVIVIGSPIVLLETGRKGASATFSGGNETNTLSFVYHVAVGDRSARLDVVDDRGGNVQLNYVKSLDLANRAQILRLSTNPSTSAIVTLPAPGEPGSLSLAKAIVVDSVQPSIVDVLSGSDDGTYDVGDEIEVLVKFSHKVVVVGIPQIVLNVVASSVRTALYKSGSGTAVLRFLYNPTLGDSTRNTPLDIRDKSSFILKPLLAGREITLPPAQILCVAETPILAADVTMPRPGEPLQANSVRSLVGNSKKLFVRTDGFRIKDVRTDLLSGEVYSPGQRVVVSVVFTGTVLVQGAPRLRLNANVLLPAYASYVQGSGSSVLEFQYVVVNGDSCSMLDIASRTALELNGGMVTDERGVYVPLRLGAPFLPGSLSFNSRIELSSAAPTVIRVYSVNANGTYGVGDELQIAVVFSKRVTFLSGVAVVHPAPSLGLQMSAAVRTAAYASGDGTRTLLFKYRIQSGDSTQKLEYASQAALTGTLFALATTSIVAANAQLPAPGTAPLSLSRQSSIQVDSSPPKVVLVTAVDRNGTYSLSDRLRFRVRFSYRVVVVSPAAGSCGLELSLGNRVARVAAYAGGSSTRVLEFVYTILAGDRTGRLDYAARDSLKCSILQYSAQPSLGASTDLPLPGSDRSLSDSSDIRVDTNAPRITSVSSSLSNGVYGAGQAIDITVSFSETILSTLGQLQLRLSIGSAEGAAGASVAAYVAGVGTPTLLFRYTTKKGDMALPLEYDGVDALSMDSMDGKIFAAADGSPTFRVASLRLPAPLSTGSLSNNRDIRIDTLEPPRVIAVTSSTPDGVYTAGDTLSITVSFSTPVVVTGTPRLRLDTGGRQLGVALYVSGSSTANLEFQYVVQVGDRVDRLDYSRCPETERRAPARREWDKLVICAKPANALQVGVGGSIRRLATTPSTDAVLDLPEVSSWPKLRFHTSRDDYVYVDQVEATTDIMRSERSLSPVVVNEFTISFQRSSIRMYSNGVPAHSSALKSSIKEQRYFVELKRFAEQQSLPLAVPSSAHDGFLGMFLNGIPFRNASTDAAIASLATDACGGAVDTSGRYFYSGLPTCYLADLGELSVESSHRAPSPVVGYAFDGFPVYGFFSERGELPQDLDDCNGRVRGDSQYCYHLVPLGRDRASFMPCLKGVDGSQAASQLRVFRFPVDVHAVEGLSLANLSRFDGIVVDENPSTQLTDSVWLNPTGVSVVYTSTSVVVRTTGVPNGAYGPFPNAYNQNSVKAQNHVFTFPRQPIAQASPTALTPDVPVGVMINGVPFFASTSSVYGGDVMASSSPALRLLDKCNGLVDRGGDYRYYASPDCLLRELKADERNKPSPLIGYAFDGFPLYGPYNEDGALPTDLDQCNGRVGYDGTYRYHATSTAPYLIGCFRGLPGTGSTVPESLYRSLSYGHNLRIDTEPPRPVQVFTSKAASTFVAGETLDIVVQWSWPVKVDLTGGRPSVAVANSTQRALFDAVKSSPMSSVFIYSVQSDVGVFAFDYRTAVSLNGATIRRLAMTPTLAASLQLVSAETIPRFASKHQLVRNIKVSLRGLYHPQASDLQVRLFHETKNAVVISNCCSATDAFGLPDDSLRVNREHLQVFPENPTSGVGFDYAFQDLNGVKNLAADGGATALQSSTSASCHASKAIDGRVKGYVSDQSVARTAAKQNQSAWWELRLVKSAEIGTVRLWLAQEELLPAVVQTLRVNANDAVSAVDGWFTLVFTTSSGSQLVTARINYNAVAMVVDEDPKIENLGIGKGESVQAKLAVLPGMPRIFVTRAPADASMSANGAFSWSITFLENPKLYGEDVAPVRVGQNAVCGGTGIVELATPHPGDDSDRWNYVERDDRRDSVVIGKLSMFPFWVMLFEDSAMMNFESFQDAYDAAIWRERVDATLRPVVTVNPPLNTRARYIRVVAEQSYAYLTLAEVQVFKERSHLLSRYEGGTPIATEFHPGAETWSPEDPFDAAFGAMTSEGTWTLVVRDAVHKTQHGEHTRHGEGAISDWVLTVTDMSGATRVYFMDIRARVKSLPRHGKLYIDAQEAAADDLDQDRNGVVDSLEASVYLSRFLENYDTLPVLLQKRRVLGFVESCSKFSGAEILSDASEREKLVPIACDARCLADIGMDPYFDTNTEKGDIGAKRLYLTGDRSVKYVPNIGFRGRDYITFSVMIGTTESDGLGSVELDVRECDDAACSKELKFVKRERKVVRPSTLEAM